MLTTGTLCHIDYTYNMGKYLSLLYLTHPKSHPRLIFGQKAYISVTNSSQDKLHMSRMWKCMTFLTDINSREREYYKKPSVMICAPYILQQTYQWSNSGFINSKKIFQIAPN